MSNEWLDICSASELTENIGVRALLGQEQVAVFKIKGDLYAVSAIDPFTDAAVLARGIVGDLQGKIVVASPIHKQHFDLKTGECLEDEAVSIKTYAIREESGSVQLAVA